MFFYHSLRLLVLHGKHCHFVRPGGAVPGLAGLVTDSDTMAMVKDEEKDRVNTHDWWEVHIPCTCTTGVKNGWKRKAVVWCGANAGANACTNERCHHLVLVGA